MSCECSRAAFRSASFSFRATRPREVRCLLMRQNVAARACLIVISPSCLLAFGQPAAAAIAIAFALVLAAPAAHADVEWLCRPGLASDPCHGDQTTTFVKPNGAAHVSRLPVAKPKPVDCFYVYPTTSNQPTTNATKSPDPEIRSIARYQAQRFSTRCRLFVPLYR